MRQSQPIWDQPTTKGCCPPIGSHVSHPTDISTATRLVINHNTGPILGLRPANERRCYIVTTSLIGWPQTYNQPCNIDKRDQSLFSLRVKVSYRQISWSLEAARSHVIMIDLKSDRMSNFRVIRKVLTRISRLRDFAGSCGKTSVRTHREFDIVSEKMDN